jgi:hypothetical protein
LARGLDFMSCCINASPFEKIPINKELTIYSFSEPNTFAFN